MWARHWLWVGAAFCAAAIAGPPPPAPPPASQGTSQSPASGTQAPTGTEQLPDDELIEFLGADDMGDAAWWEFLKKVPQRRGSPSATPPREALQ
jgi:hypothetical protein